MYLSAIMVEEAATFGYLSAAEQAAAAKFTPAPPQPTQADIEAAFAKATDDQLLAELQTAEPAILLALQAAGKAGTPATGPGGKMFTAPMVQRLVPLVAKEMKRRDLAAGSSKVALYGGIGLTLLVVLYLATRNK